MCLLWNSVVFLLPFLFEASATPYSNVYIIDGRLLPPNARSFQPIPAEAQANLTEIRLNDLTIAAPALLGSLQLAANLQVLNLTNVQLQGTFTSKVQLPNLRLFILQLSYFPLRTAESFLGLFPFSSSSGGSLGMDDVFRLGARLLLRWRNGPTFFQYNPEPRTLLLSLLPFANEVLALSAQALGLTALELYRVTIDSKSVPLNLTRLQLLHVTFSNGNLAEVLRRNRNLGQLRIEWAEGTFFSSDLPDRLTGLWLKGGEEGRGMRYYPKKVLGALESYKLGPLSMEEGLYFRFRRVFPGLRFLNFPAHEGAYDLIIEAVGIPTIEVILVEGTGDQEWMDGRRELDPVLGNLSSGGGHFVIENRNGTVGARDLGYGEYLDLENAFFNAYFGFRRLEYDVEVNLTCFIDTDIIDPKCRALDLET